MEGLVIGALQSHLMDPALLAEFCEYTRHLNKLRTEKNASLRGARDELARLTKQREKNIIQAIKDGYPGTTSFRTFYPAAGEPTAPRGFHCWSAVNSDRPCQLQKIDHQFYAITAIGDLRDVNSSAIRPTAAKAAPAAQGAQV